jgi:hypothetical protein
MAGDGSTASAAVTEKVAAAPLGPVASTVIVPGVSTVGATRSTTLTVNVPGADVLLDASVAVQETVVVPSGNIWPEEWSHETDGEGSIASVAVTEKVTAAPAGPRASATIGPGRDRVGGVASARLTVTVKLAVAVFEPSFAEHVTVVEPTAKVDPDRGEQSGVTLATASVAVTGGSYVTGVPAGSAVVTLIFPGVVITGGVVSTTLTVNVAADVLPAASFAEHETLVVPSGNVAPDAPVHETAGAGSTRSAAVAENETVAPWGPVASAVIGPGTLTSGGVVSTTLTLNEPAGFPPASVQVTVVGPSGNVDPEAGVHVKAPLS